MHKIARTYTYVVIYIILRLCLEKVSHKVSMHLAKTSQLCQHWNCCEDVYLQRCLAYGAEPRPDIQNLNQKVNQQSRLHLRFFLPGVLWPFIFLWLHPSWNKGVSSDITGHVFLTSQFSLSLPLSDMTTSLFSLSEIIIFSLFNLKLFLLHQFNQD